MATSSDSNKPTRWESFSVVILIAILLLGAYFRFTGLDWDKTYHLHPDERFLTIVASQLESVSNPLTYLRTSESPLNPYNTGQGFYVYGNFPMTVTRYVAEWTTAVCATATIDPDNPPTLCPYTYTAYDGIHLLGRFLSGFVDLLAVFFTFLMGRRLYDWRVGLVAAFLQATAVMPIQQSHFFTMDNWASSLTIMALYAAVRAAGLGDEKLGWRSSWYILFGLSLGLAVSSRINIAPLAGMIAVSGIIWLERGGFDWRRFFSAPIQTAVTNLDLQRVITGVLLAAVVSLVTFRLAQPYAFADSTLARDADLAETGQEPGALTLAIQSIIGFNPQWTSNMEEIQRLQAPEASFPPALQWTDRPALVFPLTNMVLYGMGITAALAAIVGFCLALWRTARLRPDWTVHAIPVIWSGSYFLFMGTRWVKSIRYFLPIYPTLFILAGWVLFEMWRSVGSGEWRVRPTPHSLHSTLLLRTVGIILFLLVMLPSLLWANAFVKIYQQPVTRVAASEWMYDHIPSGATLLYEANGEQREYQLPLKEFEFVPGGIPLTLNFTMPEDGTITAVRFNFLTDPDGPGGTLPVLRLALDANGGTAPFVETTLNLTQEREAVTLDLPDTFAAADSNHQLIANGDGSVVRAGTTRIANEHWDDLLPVAINGRYAYSSYYTEVSGGQRPVTYPDSDPQKLNDILAWLDEADYISLSSQRAMWHLPRLPLTYPLMIRYYEGLFNGDLGFELVAQFHADHQIGPLHISDTSGQFSWGTAPNVGWPPPGDLAAEEAFSVYDHPPVWIFKKTANYDSLKVAALFREVDLRETAVMNPQEATQAPNGLLLSPAEVAVQRSNGSYSDLFDSALNGRPALAAVVWWLAVILLGWLAFPLTFTTLRGLPDRGYALSRILSLLLISYFGWITASLNLLPNSRTTLWLGVALLAALNLALAMRHRAKLTNFIRRNLRYIGLVELLGIAFFLILIAVRLGNPDVWDIIWGGEKPMDLSFFTATLKSTTFPPYDPWYAGGYINYYYYGFVYVGALTKLLALTPTLAYNLILPMLFSFTGLGVFGLAYNLVEIRDWGLEIEDDPQQSPISNPQSPNLPISQSPNRRAIAAGLTASALAVLLGNLGEVGVVINAWYRAGDATLGTTPLIGPLLQLLQGGFRILGGQPAPIYPGDWFWTASRAINAYQGEAQPITEFPFFTFLYGDLHAHMISLPLMVLALGWAISLALLAYNLSFPRRRESNGRLWIPAFAGMTHGAALPLQLLMGGLTIGVLRATNIADSPTFSVIGALAMLFYVYQKYGSRWSLPMVGEWGLLTAVLLLLAQLLFAPFIENYGFAYGSIGLWEGSKTYLFNYLTIYGLFLFFIATHLAREFRAWTRTWTTEGLQKLKPVAMPLLIALFLYVLIILIFMLRGYWVAPVVLTLLGIAGLLGLRHELPPARRIVLILISAALGLTLFVEIFVTAGDIGRMNTVFKIYMQVWLLLSVVGGVTAVWAWPSVQKRSETTRHIWKIALAVLVAAAALYPILATKAKWDIRMTQTAPHTLDGMAFMPYAEYGDTAFDGSSRTIQLASDYEALRWMQQNIPGSPVIAEAHSGNPYRSVGNRVAMYTGNPAIVGWDWHTRQHKAVIPGQFISNRINDVNTLYNTADVVEAERLLNKYDVGYIYVGQLEQAYYHPEGLGKFSQMAASGLLEMVYSQNGVSIYKVMDTQSVGY